MATYNIDMRGPMSFPTDTGWVSSASYPTVFELDNWTYTTWSPNEFPLVSGAFVYDINYYHSILQIGEHALVYKYGNKEVWVGRSGDSSMYISFRKDGVEVTGTSTSGGTWGDIRYIGFVFCYINGYIDVAGVSYDYYRAGGWYNFTVNALRGGDSTNANKLMNWLGNDYSYGYTFVSFNLLKGNSGQYRCYLTKLKDESVPDQLPDYHEFVFDEFERITDESSIWNSFLNAPVGVEREICWSGNCKMTLTVSNTSDDAIKLFTFKFYVPSSDTPFYSVDYNISVNSSTASNNYRNFYLSFLYDEGNQVGVFYPIVYVPLSAANYRHPASTAMTDSEKATMFLWLMSTDAGEDDRPDPTNPYDVGTEDNGGNPDGYDANQDSLVTTTPPTLDASTSGLYRIYCPTDSQLVDIASFLWSSNFIDNVKKYFGNVADNIIAFYVLPYKPLNLPTKTFRVGTVDSEVENVEYVYDRFVSIDMGSLVVDDRWDSYLDFGPYTKFNIYLPGIGVQALDADDIMCPANMNGSLPSKLGSTISLTYNMDLMTGILVCFVKINGQVRYQFSGRIGYQIPLSGETHRSFMQGFAMATAGLVGMIATGGSSAPFTAAAATAGIVNAMKPDVYRGGNLSGDASSLCYKTPYLIRRSPNKPMLVDQQKFTGFQSYKTGLLSEFSGYTEVEDAHVEGISCTEEEREMIIDWLRKGVIL